MARKRARKPKLGIAERAYLAGIIDGEGSIMMIHHPARGSAGNRWEYWVLRVAISNCDKRLIDWLEELFGEGHSVCRNGRDNQRDAYQWRMDSKAALPVLEAAYPYLKLKKAQADLAFEMIGTHKLVGRAGHPPETIEKRRRIPLEMKMLNRRGYGEEAA